MGKPNRHEKRRHYEHRDDPSITVTMGGEDDESHRPAPVAPSGDYYDTRLDNLRAGDEVLSCKEKGCENRFVFTVRDQEFYKQEGFTKPFRCPPCRQKKKLERANRQPTNHGR